jgi:hypothetical protein
MEAASEIRKIAFLGDYLPRKCGIATFTSDVLSAAAADLYERSTDSCHREWPLRPDVSPFLTHRIPPPVRTALSKLQAHENAKNIPQHGTA